MALKVSLFRKKVGQWGHMHLVNAVKSADSPLHVIHEVTVRTVVESCENLDLTQSLLKFNWTLTEDFGASSDVLDEIHMFSLGKLYGVGERIAQTIEGSFREQEVADAGKVGKRKARGISTREESDVVRRSETSDDQGVDVDVPCKIAGTASGPVQGRLVGERGPVARYRISYQWEKCDAAHGSGGSEFKLVE
jgi:hypothetical protein